MLVSHCRVQPVPHVDGDIYELPPESGPAVHTGPGVPGLLRAHRGHGELAGGQSQAVEAHPLLSAPGLDGGEVLLGPGVNVWHGNEQ